MRVLIFMFATLLAFFLLSIAIAIGVSVGIVLGYATLRKKESENG